MNDDEEDLLEIQRERGIHFPQNRDSTFCCCCCCCLRHA